MYCSNCGHELLPDSKFCSNCGAPVQTGAPTEPAPPTDESDRERERREDFERAWGSHSARPESSAPEPSEEVEESYTSLDAGDEFSGGFATDRKATWEIEREQLRSGATDEWTMSDPGPAPPRRRRTWLWVLLGLIALVVIACCVFFWWVIGTESGQNWIEGVATEAAIQVQNATEQAATPQP